MELNPSKNTRLYGMSYFFNEIKNLYDLKKMPTKILLSGKKGLGKSTLAYHLVNYILSENEELKYDSRQFIINKDKLSTETKVLTKDRQRKKSGNKNKILTNFILFF